MDEPRLKIELVPKSCWFTNVRNRVNRKQWDRIRRNVYIKARYQCQICNRLCLDYPLQAHEVWGYEEHTGYNVQKLVNIIALCKDCHEVKHAKLAEINGRLEMVFKHLMQVNHWTKAEAINHHEQEIKKWLERSKKKYELDISNLERWER